MSVAVGTIESVCGSGDATNGRSAVTRYANVAARGAPSRHIDLQTALLDRYARSWIDLAQTRKALAQREMPDEIVSEFDKLEKRVGALLSRTLRQHPLWPWLSQFPGLGGAHTALVIGRIGDPRRYPGQRCSEGHYLPPVYAVGEMCPVAVSHHGFDIGRGDGAEDAGADDSSAESVGALVCPGHMLEPRSTSGTRSLWHWAGLHVEEDGRAPRKRKGSRVTYEPRVRASVMQPGGIAEQIVRLSVPHYVDVYRETKERLSLRVVESSPESENRAGNPSISAAEREHVNDAYLGDADLGAAEFGDGIDPQSSRPLRPFEADRIARKVAAKAFLGDLLAEWKRLA